MATKESKSKKRCHEADTQDEPLKQAKSSKKEKKHKKDDKKPSKEERKAAKKAAEEELLAKLPKVDSDGIPFNKIQIRRMKRRVKHGLDPIPTEEEEREIAKRKEEEEREVEELFADQKKDNEEEGDDGDDGSDERAEVDGSDEEDDEEVPAKQQQQPVFKKARTKPVPPDYVCSACQNKPCDDREFVPHWIYDCPSKITKRGCNTKSKKTRGLTDPPSRKVFVSGLPFDVTERGVKEYFDKAGEVVHVKLLKFEDSQRCKGQGILTFDTDNGAKAALKLNGEIWTDEKPTKKRNKGDDTKKESKELRLKVSKVLNRFLTKKQKKP